MKNFKNVAVIVALCLAIVFLMLDKCGSSRKADELKGQYEEASRIAKVERLIKEEIIKEQQREITEAESTIAKINEKVAKKDKNIAELGNTVADLEEEFGNLTDKDEKIANLVTQVSIWKQKFTLAQSIITDKDDVIFSLNEKYDAQVVISLEYKSMYESTQGLLAIRDKQVVELGKINKRIRLTSGVKSGFVVILAGLIVYNMVK